MDKMGYTKFKTLFLSKYGLQWSDDFISEAYVVYFESDQLDNSLDWVQSMLIDTDM
jgi:hypothetical protein